jgi:toxin ParE1/3/4
MANYKLTNKAVEDLTKIWNYTFEFWSENQADKYYETLIQTCQKIANNPDLGKKYESIYQGLSGVKVNKHILFYRKMNNEQVEITRILHEKMDLKKKKILD